MSHDENAEAQIDNVTGEAETKLISAIAFDGIATVVCVIALLVICGLCAISGR